MVVGGDLSLAEVGQALLQFLTLTSQTKDSSRTYKASGTNCSTRLFCQCRISPGLAGQCATGSDQPPNTLDAMNSWERQCTRSLNAEGSLLSSTAVTTCNLRPIMMLRVQGRISRQGHVVTPDMMIGGCWKYGEKM
eukprot:1305385-Rhodomonas_salina.1